MINMKSSLHALVRALRPTVTSAQIPRRIPISTTPRSIHCCSVVRPKPSPFTDRRTITPGIARRRHESNLATTGENASEPQDLHPAYQLTFTCTPCRTRSTHRVTKQGYHHGTTLITCPGCKARHLISDHLKIFSDDPITLEDILKKKLSNGKPLADLLKKGKLGMRQGAIIANEGDEDIEFWEDGSETPHTRAPDNNPTNPKAN
jgi:mitochondrial protein import protein ZIM17